MMTAAEATEKAARLGLDATEEVGFCVLRPQGGGCFVARGGTWEEAFALLAAPRRVEARPVAVRPKQPVPTMFDGLEQS
jgi:hypothetical protein